MVLVICMCATDPYECDSGVVRGVCKVGVLASVPFEGFVKSADGSPGLCCDGEREGPKQSVVAGPGEDVLAVRRGGARRVRRGQSRQYVCVVGMYIFLQVGNRAAEQRVRVGVRRGAVSREHVRAREAVGIQEYQDGRARGDRSFSAPVASRTEMQAVRSRRDMYHLGIGKLRYGRRRVAVEPYQEAVYGRSGEQPLLPTDMVEPRCGADGDNCGA